MQALPHVAEAVNKLNERLKPARLNQTSGKNIGLLFGWLADAKINVLTSTSDEIADALYKSVREHLFQRQLVWDVPPKALTAEKALAGPVKLKSAITSENELAAKQKADEARIAYEKKQKEAEQRIILLIENFVPLNTRGTATDHVQQERVQTYLRKYVERERGRKADMTKVAEVVATTIAKEYADLERRNQFSGSGSINDSMRTTSREW